MSEFLTLVTPPEARKILFDHLVPNPVPEEIDTADSLSRITFAPILAPLSLPSFPRTTVDGYAVRASDTYGANESLPAYLRVAGEIKMGRAPTVSLKPGETALIHTGGMLPEGADAVVMVEYTQEARGGEVEIMRAVGDGENVLQTGEDVLEGDVVIPKGTRLRAAEIGGLMALGIDRVTVARRPRVAILSSGDEVVSPGSELGPGQVFDVNTYTLQALIQQSGGDPVPFGIIPDEATAFREAAARALDQCDLVLFTAGSSVSVRDLTAATIETLGEPGLLVHGISIRPGKPTILAVCDGKPVIGLPGNPVSALVIAGIFVTPVVEALSGLSQARPNAVVEARLSLNLSSQAGREDWVSVQLVEGLDGYTAEPIFGKSNLIFTLARADGLIRIPPDANGLAAGETVAVHLI